eukprot:2477141-Pyramimonas_sp.AAC.1
MTTRIVAQKGHRAGKIMLRKSCDATSAFGCGRKLDLELGVRQRLEVDKGVEDADVSFVADVPHKRRLALAVIVPGTRRGDRSAEWGGRLRGRRIRA